MGNFSTGKLIAWLMFVVQVLNAIVAFIDPVIVFLKQVNPEPQNLIGNQKSFWSNLIVAVVAGTVQSVLPRIQPKK